MHKRVTSFGIERTTMYKLEPDKVSEDEFYLLFNGSLFMPFSKPPLLGTRNFCMETFWNASNPAGVTLPLVCFSTPLEEAGTRYIGATVSRRSMRRRFAWYSAYAVFLPVLLLIVTITMDLSPAVPSTYLKPNFGVKGCWFKTDQAALPYFYGPVAVILLSNLVIFLLTSRAFAKHHNKLKDVSPLDLNHSDFSTSDDWMRLGTVLGQPLPVHQHDRSPTQEPLINFNQRLKKYKKIFRTCCLLSIIMGLSWVLEVVSWAAGAGTAVVSVWSVFDLINALQGVVIFAIYVLQQPVRSFESR
ncbi:unnamed protein product [Leptidea sinapis]|uniref:G-protein coupled receptors family 2 profile 2 domain-containing protein n=1 Tax=Leptidea sinapis TaxID=189913 RepID=A0A5E4R2V6_9NEOP|nr:unnamed protein product [Leptidea sinapis]